MRAWLRAHKPPDIIVRPTHVFVVFLIFCGAIWGLEERQNHSFNGFVRELDSRNDKISVEGCKRGNLRSAYELANHSDGPERLELVEEVLPLVNCEKTQVVGHYTVINRSVQERYVNILLNRHRWPQINVQGQISGTQPLPSNAQKP